MNLIIVESPTKARTLSRFLGRDYKIEASMGHVRDLPQSKLGIDVESDFNPTYEVSAKKKDKVAELKKFAAGADRIILATDPDREGEAIAWHIAELLTKNKRQGNGNNKGFDRIAFHEITESAIKEALAHPRTIDTNLVDAQQARRILDRLVGYKLSPLLWRKIRRGLSAGRVQSVAVRLIVERERIILAFLPVEYWEIVAKLKKESPYKGDSFLKSLPEEFAAKLFKVGENAVEINSQEQVNGILQKLQLAKYQVGSVTRKEVKRVPYPPFTTSTLQQSASNLFGWSAKRTMQIAQNLYEEGLITYHRTDSTNLAAESITMVRDFIGQQYGPHYLPEEPRLYKTKSKVAQEAHEAIRPTKIDSKHSLENRDSEKLYELIWKRFVACQMKDALYEQMAVDVVADNYIFRANGSKILFEGWKKLFGKEEGDEEQKLPDLSSLDKLDLLGLTPSQHFTQPPPRYTEASLIKALEEYGIGRPSTYAPIISTIQERQYVEKVEKKLTPTPLAMAVNDFLMTNFANVLDYQFTALMEDELDNIANGQKKWIPVIREFYEPFSKQLGKVEETAQRIKIEVEQTNEICPECGSPLVIRTGRFGKFLACSKFPDCKFTKQYQKKLDIKCPKCGGDIIVKRTKTKKTFYGCGNYPNCDWASWNKPKVDVVCPLA